MRSLETASRSATWRASVRRGRLRVRLTRSMRRSPAYRRLSLRLRRTRFDSPDTPASALVRGRRPLSLPRRGPQCRVVGTAGGRTAVSGQPPPQTFDSADTHAGALVRGRGRVSFARRGPPLRDMGGAGGRTAFWRALRGGGRVSFPRRGTH